MKIIYFKYNNLFLRIFRGECEPIDFRKGNAFKSCHFMNKTEKAISFSFPVQKKEENSILFLPFLVEKTARP